jgi:hypothetical protein
MNKVLQELDISKNNRTDREQLHTHMGANNFTLLRYDDWNSAVVHGRNYAYRPIEAILRRNESLRWCNVHAMILNTVIALAPLDLPGYVLLWTINCLPWLEQVHGDLRKITLITAIIASIRRVSAQRNSRAGANY